VACVLARARRRSGPEAAFGLGGGAGRKAAASVCGVGLAAPATRGARKRVRHGGGVPLGKGIERFAGETRESLVACVLARARRRSGPEAALGLGGGTWRNAAAPVSGVVLRLGRRVAPASGYATGRRAAWQGERAVRGGTRPSFVACVLARALRRSGPEAALGLGGGTWRNAAVPVCGVVLRPRRRAAPASGHATGGRRFTFWRGVRASSVRPAPTGRAASRSCRLCGCSRREARRAPPSCGSAPARSGRGSPCLRC